MSSRSDFAQFEFMELFILLKGKGEDGLKRIVEVTEFNMKLKNMD